MGIKKSRFKETIIPNFKKKCLSPSFYPAKQNLYTTKYNFSIRGKEIYSVNRGKTCANIRRFGKIRVVNER